MVEKKLRNLEAEQARAGMTDQQVADALGITRKSYFNKKMNYCSFKIEECKKLTELFGVDFDYLFKEYDV